MKYFFEVENDGIKFMKVNEPLSGQRVHSDTETKDKYMVKH